MRLGAPALGYGVHAEFRREPALEALPPIRYLADRQWLWMLCGFAVILIVLPILMMVLSDARTNSGQTYQQTGGVLLVLTASFAFLLFLLAHRRQLLVSGSGVELVDHTATVRVSWADIERISLLGHMTGVILKHSPQVWQTGERNGVSTLLIVRTPLYSPEQRQLVAQGRFIDLRLFAAQLRSEEFMQRLAAYAPHVEARTREGLRAL